MAYVPREQLADLGYMAIVKEVTPGTVPSVPGVYVPLYSESMVRNLNNHIDTPIVGQKYKSWQALHGMYDYQGGVEVMGEPNTVGYMFDMLLTKGATTGANPYTHPFTLAAATLPNSYTVDIATERRVTRFFGVSASEINPTWAENEMHLNMKMSALGSLSSRTVATIATTTLTLGVSHVPAPSTGFIAGDLVRVMAVDNSVNPLDTTISSITDGITIVLGASAAAFATALAGTGVIIMLRPATPSYTLLTPFLFSSTQFCFAATASSALSAAHTPMEEGSTWTVQHMFKDTKGEHRSGSQNPASLVRTEGDTQVTLKKYFDTLVDVDNYQNLTGQALVVRHYAGSTNQYELRLTFNDFRIMDDPKPPLKVGEVLFSDFKVQPVYKSADSQAFDVKVINAVATI